MSSAPIALITGGAGFVGTNLADQLVLSGREVIVFDSLARDGVRANLEWLAHRHPGRVTGIVGDVRDERAVRAVVDRADEIYHLAAQVAVTTSLDDPLRDFEVNARGTLNVLEAVRAKRTRTPLIYTSTNKVYGALTDIMLAQGASRYVPADPTIRALGVSERRPLDFHSPYGCSKGCADQYVLDYARTFDLQAVVFRMSCIYGPHQRGNEDQGWVAHFLISAQNGRPLTVYGNGLQVRDVLYIDDLVAAFGLAMQNMAMLSGHAFNIGGGPANTLSLVELITYLEKECDSLPDVQHAAARLGDQKYYVSDTTRFSTATGWLPAVSTTEGLQRLRAWLTDESDAGENDVRSSPDRTSLPTALGATR
jgi:CDP-paratose 2-epimerase